ncbi:peptidylprolyl isomerase fpr4, partial [Podochytrium sp. JEL0797]
DISELIGDDDDEDDEEEEEMVGNKRKAVASKKEQKKPKIVELEDDEEEEVVAVKKVQPKKEEPKKKEAKKEEPKKKEAKKEEPKKKEAKKEEPKKKEAKKEEAAPKKESNKKTLSNGLVIEEIVVGNGPAAKNGQKVGVRYVGKLMNGKIFDSNNSGKPFSFKLGAGQVIKGWDLGVNGMKVGGTRKLTIPAPLAYGSRGAPPDIPSNATLSFEVKLLSV